MRRKKHSDRGGGGGGGELFICFTSRPSTASSGLRPSASSKAFSPGRGGGSDTAPPAALRPSLSRRLRNSGSLKGGQSPMFPPGTASAASGGRRGRGGMEPAEPSSPKVTCIGQVRVKGGKRKPKHGSAASAAALRSRSRRGVGGALGSESSFRRGTDDRDGGGLAGGKNQNQGWVYQIPVNICEALKTFGSCGGRSLCSPSRDRPRSAGAGDKKRRRAPPGGSWLCGAAVARCLLAIQEEEDDVGKGSAVGPADEDRKSEVGLVMQGWDVEDGQEEYEDDAAVVVGEVEVEKEDEILLVGGKEEEGRVSVCIPPRNALLLMRCRSDPVRMAALATRFWGSPAAASVGQVVDNEGDTGHTEEEVKEEFEDNADKEHEEEAARNSMVSVDDAVCREHGVVEDGSCEARDACQVQTEAEECSKHEDLGEEENGGGCRGDGEENDDEPVEAQIVRKDRGLEVASAGDEPNSESQAPEMVETVVDTKEDADVSRPEKEEEDVKGRRSVSSCSPSTALKEDRKLRRLGSKRRVSSSSRASSSSDRVDRRHSFSAEMEARRSSFSSLKDSRRASFSIDRDGRRWSFTIEQEHLVAEPKVLMASRKGMKNSSDLPESEKDCAVLVVAPNSLEEAQESNDDGKEEAAKDGEEEGSTEGAEINTEVENVETKVDEKEAVEVKQERRKKSGELPDCLLMMMCEPKLSMEVSKETWVCSTDFVHWKSYQGQNRRQQKAATGSNAPASEENKDADNAQDTSVANDRKESGVPAPARSASMPPQVVVLKPPPKPAVEKKLKLEPPMVTSVAAYAPLVLQRCKSEPLRSSARLAPDACFWKDRHRPLNATGIGF
uniref:Uncharacterized protein n=1 Tax=Avena sativa TaxID=4498 RepID=A0ACD5T798_AVESA